jgi:hypothetical protein
LGHSGQPVEDEGGPQQPPFPQKPKTQSQRSRISTSKSPAVFDTFETSLMIATGQ